ncbi:NAD-dependent epimerase/dehydratase family protein [Dyadobacter sp. Leaf189]|uniref:NAD-dependent epimerase/dehydratase family protein n=1 Tax=Dyadobacter sp. Leaf189 TaxID=1736295 RepID=UPI0006F70EE5|nr:NAD-dependent epimerase/dehydratase family protein [Dyadobacter sp. Leaf189]KQS25477.1 NAD-dependent dehydratase [Dyadobacter sp. Leaf189]
MSGEASKIEKKRISILGCGWLGIALAQRLVGDPITSQIKCSTTSESKLAKFNALGFEGFLLDLTPGFTADSEKVNAFFDVDSLVVSLPPRSSQHEPGFYAQQIQAVVSSVRESPVKEVLFISSTSIYPDLNRTVTEEDVTTPEESAYSEMVQAEQLITSLRPQCTASILRFGGLLGYNRIPGKYVQGKKDMTTGTVPVNYIHRDDGAAITLEMLKQGVCNETFNIVAPLHPTRSEIYIDTCAQFGWEAPTFADGRQPDFKIVSNRKLTETYKYDFLYPDPLQFLYSLEDPI